MDRETGLGFGGLGIGRIVIAIFSSALFALSLSFCLFLSQILGSFRVGRQAGSFYFLLLLPFLLVVFSVSLRTSLHAVWLPSSGCFTAVAVVVVPALHGISLLIHC